MTDSAENKTYPLEDYRKAFRPTLAQFSVPGLTSDIETIYNDPDEYVMVFRGAHKDLEGLWIPCGVVGTPSKPPDVDLSAVKATCGMMGRNAKFYFRQANALRRILPKLQLRGRDVGHCYIEYRHNKSANGPSEVYGKIVISEMIVQSNPPQVVQLVALFSLYSLHSGGLNMGADVSVMLCIEKRGTDPGIAQAPSSLWIDAGSGLLGEGSEFSYEFIHRIASIQPDSFGDTESARYVACEAMLKTRGEDGLIEVWTERANERWATALGFIGMIGSLCRVLPASPSNP